jgi:hypothetical protein
VVNESVAFALGVGQRALDKLIALAKSKRRGYAKQVSLADWGVFQRAVAEGELPCVRHASWPSRCSNGPGKRCVRDNRYDSHRRRAVPE